MKEKEGNEEKYGYKGKLIKESQMEGKKGRETRKKKKNGDKGIQGRKEKYVTPSPPPIIKSFSIAEFPYFMMNISETNRNMEFTFIFTSFGVLLIAIKKAKKSS